MHTLGIDLGSSSIKASLLEADSGRVIASAQEPESELPMAAHRAGWAEQDPATWWDAAVKATRRALEKAGAAGSDVRAIGIAYQMHGLVAMDERGRPLRQSIIWCDSRAVDIGKAAFDAIGHERCLDTLLNSPGNFTASKLAWVRRHEPDLYKRIKVIGLPGDYLAGCLTGRVCTTLSGLSEGMFWDFQAGDVADFLLEHYAIDPSLLAPRVPTFGHQGELTRDAAEALGLHRGTPVTYRAGDQPNNALSLNVPEPGEVAATAGTSGVVYGVTDQLAVDRRSRVNTFAHVNHAPDRRRLGVLLCINGTGSANAWARRTLGQRLSYEALNDLAATAPPGADGVSFLPFGNGAERLLDNREIGAQLLGVNFNRHEPAHLARAVQEGIVFSFCHGLKVLAATGVDAKVIRAGHVNMFLSPLFRRTLATASGAAIELYDTDGAAGAARGAALGAGLFATPAEAFASLQQVGRVEPIDDEKDRLSDAFDLWRERLEHAL